MGICPGSVCPNRHEVKAGRGGTPLSDLNRDVRPDKVWFSQGFVLNVVRVYVITANSSTTLAIKL